MTQKAKLASQATGKGFKILKEDDLIPGKQFINYRSLIHFFESIRINKIKK